MSALPSFVLVGGLAAGVHLAAYAGLSRGWPAAPPEALNLAAFGLAFGVSFIGHRRLSFRDTTLPWQRSLLRFGATALAGLLTNEATLALLHRGLGLDAVLAVAAGIGVAAGQTFVLGRYWAFRR